MFDVTAQLPRGLSQSNTALALLLSMLCLVGIGKVGSALPAVHSSY